MASIDCGWGIVHLFLLDVSVSGRKLRYGLAGLSSRSRQAGGSEGWHDEASATRVGLVLGRDEGRVTEVSRGQMQNAPL